MKSTKFEDYLESMSKPEIMELKHRETIALAVIKSRNRQAVGLWWISIPVYLIVMLIMKSIFMPSKNWIHNLHELKGSEHFGSLLFFIVVPSIIILLNILNMRKMAYLAGSPNGSGLFRLVWVQACMIIISAIIIFIYFL